MKKFTKLLGIVLIIALVMSMGTMALAAGNSITVDLNFKGQTYTLYKIFNATTNAERQAAEDADHDTSVTTDGIAYTLIDETDHALTKEYSITTADGTTKTVKAGDWFEYVNDSSKNIKIKDGASITTEDFRLFAEKYGVQTGSALTATSNNDGNIKWQNLEDGYYFIKTTTGSLVTVDSVAPNAIVKDKNQVPTIDKTVQEDSLVAANNGADGDGVTAYQKQNDQEIGKTVYYKSVIKAHKGATGYVVYDKLSKGLTFDGVDSITVYKGTVASANVVAATNYTPAIADKYYKGSDGTETALQTGESAFSVTFKQSFLDTIDADVDLIITYTAKVNSDAIVNTAIPNDTTLKYGTDSYTEESTTHTFVWGIDVLKIDGSDSSKKLAGAQFVIYRTETVAASGETPASTNVYYAKFASNNKLTGWSSADSTAETALVAKEPSYFSGTPYEATILVTGTDGTVAVTGLDEGSYKLLEVKAPDGYNKLSAAVDATIDSTSDTATAQTLENPISAGTNGSKNVPVENNSGAVLPSTGGIGTTIFYVVGSILVVAAGVLLITKKRMGRE